MESYPAGVEAQMKSFYQSLSEKDRRRYAAVEALKLGYGGQQYIWRLLGCDRESIKLGMRELNDPQALSSPRIRRPGGGRKSAFETIPRLDEAFLRVLSQQTAGSPMNEKVRWTHLTRGEISALLEQQEGIKVSVTVVDQLLAKHHYRRRKASKRRSTGHHVQRNEQFEKIAKLREEYEASDNPVMSMDTKKRS